MKVSFLSWIQNETQMLHYNNGTAHLRVTLCKALWWLMKSQLNPEFNIRHGSSTLTMPHYKFPKLSDGLSENRCWFVNAHLDSIIWHPPASGHTCIMTVLWQQQWHDKIRWILWAVWHWYKYSTVSSYSIQYWIFIEHFAGNKMTEIRGWWLVQSPNSNQQPVISTLSMSRFSSPLSSWFHAS